MSQSWLILSGKGGVGKTLLTASLGTALARRNLKCCCVDADIGLRDLDLLLGMENSIVFDMLDVVRKDCKLKVALLEHHSLENLCLLPASQNGSSKDLDAETFEKIVRKLKKKVGYVLTDAPAGVERGLKNLLPASDYSILVTTPDDVSMRDAERVLALLDEKQKNAEEKASPYRIVYDKVCTNPACICSTEQELQQTFKCVNEEEQIYRCIWCDSRAK